MAYSKISGFADEIDAVVDKQFEVLDKLNMKYFEVRGVDGKNISTLSEEEVFKLKEKMEQHGIQVSSIGSPIGKVKLEEPFEEHFELFKKVVEIAKNLNTKYIRMFSFYHDGGDVWTEEERAEVLVRLRKMIEYAREQDIILLHENEKDIYGDTAERCADLMKELHCENFKAVFDPANFVQCKQDNKYAYELLKDYIAYVHIKDARYADNKVVPAGMGDGEVPYVLKELFANGYDGFVSLEPHLGHFSGLAALELDDYLRYGNIKNSVNFPNVSMPFSADKRMCVLHANVPNVISQITAALSETGANIENMMNKSKGDNAYTMVDITGEVTENAANKIAAIEGVYRVRVI